MATGTSLTSSLSAATQPVEAQPDATRELVRGVRAQLATPVPGVNDYLRAWADWYRGALDAIREVEIGGASAGTIARIDAARREVDRALDQARRQIFSE